MQSLRIIWVLYVCLHYYLLKYSQFILYILLNFWHSQLKPNFPEETSQELREGESSICPVPDLSAHCRQNILNE